MKVSIALCTFNGARFVQQQINSFLAQTRRPDEIVVCDDGSEDDTLAIIRQLAAQSADIHWRIEQNKPPLSARWNFEKALSLCTGDVIFLSDQDDRWLPHRIESVVGYFQGDASVDLVFGNAGLMDESDKMLPGTLLDNTFFTADVRHEYKNEDLLYWSILLGHVMTGATMAVRRTALAEILPFHFKVGKGRPLWHDGWMAYALLTRDAVKYNDDPSVVYRVHSGQQVGIIHQKDPFDEIIMERKDIPDALISHFYPRYLLAYQFIQDFRKLKKINAAVEDRIYLEYFAKKKQYFKSQGWLERKARLVKWFVLRINDISFRDIITL